LVTSNVGNVRNNNDVFNAPAAQPNRRMQKEKPAQSGLILFHRRNRTRPQSL
jgi:hypothetical protein